MSIKVVKSIKQLTIRLDDEMHKQLRYLSIELDISINEYITKLIEKDMQKRNENKQK